MSIESGPDNVVVIKVVGVGGGGNNAVDRMVKLGIQGVDFIAINTDKPVLSKSEADLTIQIGEKLTGGRGAGSDPEIGKKAAEESRNDIAKALEGTDMVVITAGMGGGTGTGAAPIVADIAREANILTVAVVTKPFKNEGARRMQQAEDGIRELLGKVDALLVIPNERLTEVADEKITFLNAFEVADSVLMRTVVGIVELIKNTGVMNLDFADVTSIMKNAGYAHMGVGLAAGKDRAEVAARYAISSNLMETSTNGARGVILNISGSSDLTLEEFNIASDMVHESAHPDANIILGASIDDSLEDTMRVTIIATRFDDRPMPLSAALPAGEKKSAFDGKDKPADTAKTADPPDDTSADDPFDTIFKIFNSK